MAFDGEERNLAQRCGGTDLAQRKTFLLGKAAHGRNRSPSTSLIELGGTPVLRDRGGRKYWYAVQRLGARSLERYLGPDSPALRDTVERARNVRQEQRQREKERSRLASMCREGGVPGVDAATGKILRVLAKAGVFRLRGVLVGARPSAHDPRWRGLPKRSGPCWKTRTTRPS